MKKEELVQLCLENDFLISPDFFDQDLEQLEKNFIHILSQKIISKEKPIVLHKDLYTSIKKNGVVEINWLEFEKSRVLKEKRKNNKMYDAFLNFFVYAHDGQQKKKIELLLEDIKKPHTTIETDIEKEKETSTNNVIVLKNYEEQSGKRELKDFVQYFKLRYDTISKFLQNRNELTNLTSIHRLTNREHKGEASIIGLVYDKITTRSGDIMLIIEDPTGHLRVYINKNNDAFQQAQNVCYDEVIGINGMYSNNALSAKTIAFPDIINTKNKKTKTDTYVAFISDVHVGSKYFLEKEFKQFINWINGEVGDEKQRKMSKQLKYIFIAGDLVDGIGVYPNQEENLTTPDIKQQYQQLAEILSTIKRNDVRIIMCPGQHDATRISQPQPALHKEYTQPLWDLPNTTLVSNPALINIDASKDFEGFNVLVYHGASFHYYIDNFETLRKQKPRDNPCVMHKFLLQKRHLSPSHKATVYTPEPKDDPLIISTTPDVLVCGDMHKSDVSNYNGIITINCSCWQAKTDFQEKTGNNPDPGKVPFLNLKTREVTMIDFCETS